MARRDSSENLTELYNYNESINETKEEVIFYSIIKWRCSKCKSINIVEANKQLIEIKDGNISGLGKCKSEQCVSNNFFNKFKHEFIDKELYSSEENDNLQLRKRSRHNVLETDSSDYSISITESDLENKLKRK